MKNLYELLDDNGESQGVVASELHNAEVEELWTDYCTTPGGDDPLDVDEFLENWLILKDGKAHRVFLNQVAP
jgi:hypothetical protein